MKGDRVWMDVWWRLCDQRNPLSLGLENDQLAVKVWRVSMITFYFIILLELVGPTTMTLTWELNAYLLARPPQFLFPYSILYWIQFHSIVVLNGLLPAANVSAVVSATLCLERAKDY